MEAFGQNTHLQGGTHGAENAWLTYSEADLADVEMLIARYRAFLDAARPSASARPICSGRPRPAASGRLRKRSDPERRFAPVTN
jgi:hypothetical protein